jgi:hypothetical protein
MQNGQLIVNPGNKYMYSLDIYIITGQKIYFGSNMSGIQSIALGVSKGVLIVKKFSDNKISTFRINLNP